MGRTRATPGALRLLATLVVATCGLVGGCHTPPLYCPPALPAFMREDVGVSVPGCPDVPTPAPELGPPVPHAFALSGPPVLTLPEAVHETVFANLRVLAGAEKVRQAQGELLTNTLIPNPQLYMDSQLNPFNKFFPTRQGGPPQYDVYVNFPIDWLLFGKRVAAIEANRLGVEVAAADLADLVRLRVSETVTAFYGVLEARELLGLARQDYEDLTRLEAIVKERVKLGGAGVIELQRVRLSVLDSERELRVRRLALDTARNRLRPLLGRVTLNPDFDVEGTLEIAGHAKELDLAEALELAERLRPDLIARKRQVARAEADIELERRKAYPLVSVQPMFTYQVQQTTIGYPDARSWGVALTSSLPFTDRNQGNRLKAAAFQREALANLYGDLAEIRAEVQQAVETYRIALQLVKTDQEVTLETARELRDRTEAAYKIGGRSLLEVLDAQRAYRDRVRMGIVNRADYWRAWNRLNSAVGGRIVE